MDEWCVISWRRYCMMNDEQQAVHQASNSSLPCVDGLIQLSRNWDMNREIAAGIGIERGEWRQEIYIYRLGRREARGTRLKREAI
jgi:hypothetical protein